MALSQPEKKRKRAKGKIKPSYIMAEAFLKRWNPEGPWVLVAIDPDKRAIDTRSFGPDSMTTLHNWLSRHGLTRNIYFTVNPVIRPLDKKPAREHIKELAWLHVDLDPRGGEDLESERARIWKLLVDPRSQGVPVPTVIINSGGGFQGFWKLDTPLPLDGTPEEFEEAKRYNKQIEILLGGDNCHNVDRIMRLPGTVNRPDRRKRTKGRKDALASLALWDENCPTYDLSEFQKAVAGAESKPKVEASTGRKVSVGIDTSENLNGLPRDVSDFTKVVIAQGCDPDSPGRFGGTESKWGLTRGSDWDGNRSRAVYHVACALVRADVDDDTIRALLLNPEWGISAHVLAQSNSETYADRQIERAREKEDKSIARPTIYTNLGEIAEVVDAAQVALVAARVPIYQRGAELVRLIANGESGCDDNSDDIKRSAGALVIIPVIPIWLVDQMSRTGKWRKKFKDADGPSDPQEKHGRLLLGRAGQWPFPELKGVVTAPTLRADGSILQRPGYDPASGLIFAPGGWAFPPVPDRPTQEDAVAALAKFDSLFTEFPFVDDAAGAVVLSAVLSGLIRATIRAIPLHAFDAPTAGTGKSMLAETVGILMTGHEPASISQSRENGEDEKRMASLLRAGDPCILIDNAERPVGGDKLCSVITQTQVSLRILGKSESIILPCEVLIMVTGNNLQFESDMSRRTVICRLDSEEERPERREFDFDPRIVAAEQRAELVVAGLTILRAYAVAGRPNKMSSVGSFEQWNRWVREALVWCGAGDPVKTMEKLVDENQGSSELGTILDTWWKEVGDSEPTVSELKDFEDLAELLREATGRPQWNARSVGKYLSRHANKIVGGLTLRSTGGVRVKRWQVNSTRGQVPGAGTQKERDEAEKDVFG